MRTRRISLPYHADTPRATQLTPATYYILGLSFWRSEAGKMGQVVEAPELFA